jgi:hypothetical protein
LGFARVVLDGALKGRARILVHPLLEQDYAQQLLEMGGLRILPHSSLRLLQRRVQAAGVNIRHYLIGKRVLGLLRAHPSGCPQEKQAKR